MFFITELMDLWAVCIRTFKMIPVQYLYHTYVYRCIDGVSAHGCLVQFILQVSSLSYHIMQSFVRPYESWDIPSRYVRI
jgi:hypothetical protein